MDLRLRTLTLAAVVAVAGCGHAAPKIEVHDVSYESGATTVRAYLVERSGTAGARPGVVMVHGSGGDRRELLPRARELAARGAVVLLPTEPSSANPPPAPTSIHQLLAQSRDVQEADVRAALRAGDVLIRRPGVRRLGYLGWSAGAKTGAFVAARDRRFAAVALLSAGAQTVDAFVAAAPPAARPEVRRVLSTVDPIRAIAHTRPGTLLLEDGRHDEIVPRSALENVVRAAPPRTTVRWYDAGHALDDRAYDVAFTWLLRRLS